MIVPQTRLIVWVAVVVLPLSVLAAALPNATLWSVAIVAVLLILASCDALLARSSLDGIGVELPAVIRLFKGRKATIELRIKNLRKQDKKVRLGLALPPEISSPEQDLNTLLPAGAELSRLLWPCTAVQRGKYLIDRCYVEGLSPAGFWARRAAIPTTSEIRVYPDLLSERKSVAALFLNRETSGVHRQRQVGQGRDFEKLREYVPGDGYDEIHWRTTAKRGHPITKVFQIERTQEVYAVIDASRLSARVHRVPNGADEGGGSVTSALERMVTATLVLGLAAERQGDLFGILTFSDKIHHFVRAKNGKGHYSACRDALYALQPQTVTPDFEELSAFICRRLRRRALLVFLTSLDDPMLAEHFVHNIHVVSRQHLVLVNMLRRPGARPLFSDPDVTSLDDLYQHLGGHVRWHNLNELEKVLQRRGVWFALLDNERLSAQLISQYLGVKQRQLL